MLEHSLAYIDPGSGSLIIQVLIASILAIPYFLRTQIARAVGLIRRRGSSSVEDPAAPKDATNPEPG